MNHLGGNWYCLADRVECLLEAISMVILEMFTWERPPRNKEIRCHSMFLFASSAATSHMGSVLIKYVEWT